MAKETHRLSQLTVKNASKPGYMADGHGLYLQIANGGSKQWVFRYERTKRRRELGLGPTHAVTLAEARGKATELRKMLADGLDPYEVRSRAKLAAALERAKLMTFDECATAYIAAHSASWKNPKHRQQWANTLTQYAGPIFGKLPVAEVDTALVMKALQPLWTTKTETATRLRGRIESVLDWATTSKYRHGDNPARWRGHLENLLPAPGKVAKVDHHPALPWRQVGAFMADLRTREGVAARAVELAVLTAARSGEVRGATWNEFNLEGALWVIPAGRMKAGKEHRVPLSPAAVSLLKAIKEQSASDWVFPGTRAAAPLSDMSLTAVLRRMERTDITVHGFRSTFRDWCAEATNFPREVAEHALAHSLPDKVEAAYQRGDLLEKRALLMAAWADFCSKPTLAATVTTINAKAAA